MMAGHYKRRLHLDSQLIDIDTGRAVFHATRSSFSHNVREGKLEAVKGKESGLKSAALQVQTKTQFKAMNNKN